MENSKLVLFGILVLIGLAVVFVYGYNGASVSHAESNTASPSLENYSSFSAGNMTAYYKVLENPEAGSPKATIVRAPGNYIENLNAHPGQEIHPIGKIDSLVGLPVWISQDATKVTPYTYEVFWEIEPTGEYLYYLAGDYRKNGKGLLRFASSSTSSYAYISFEDDVISVSKHDDSIRQLHARKSGIDTGALFSKSLAALDAEYNFNENFDGWGGTKISLEDYLPANSNGQARLTLTKKSGGKGLLATLDYEEYREPMSALEHERMTKIQTHSANQDLRLQDIVDHFIELVYQYSEMPYSKVSGAIRM